MRFPILIALLLVFTACTPEDGPAATLLPDPASPFPTLEASATAPQAAPTAAATSLLASPDPDLALSPTVTPVQLIDPDLEIPEAEIQIYVPGPLSRLTSPFRLIGNLEPGPDYQVYIEMIGEDGRTLVRKIIRALPPGGEIRTDFISVMEFEIDALAESARIIVGVDDEYGRRRALASVGVILLSDGVTLTNPYTDTLENIVIQQPDPNVMVQGERLIVTGVARPQNDDVLVVELIDRRGVVVATGLAPVVVPEGEQYGFFAAEIPYQVEEPIWVLVVVRERGVKIPGPVHLSSIEMVISP
ncbi:MAG: hypothetical protein OEV06_02295 [Anaerolineae bacterium]|nr:hypothetical protein [Anaerolineae bacterium]